MPRNFYEFGPFTADPEIRALMRDGKVIPLAPKAFDVLLTLIQSGEPRSVASTYCRQYGAIVSSRKRM